MSGMMEKIQIEVDPTAPLRLTVDDLMKKIIDAHGGDRRRAAAAMRISPATILNRLGTKDAGRLLSPQNPAPEVEDLARSESSTAPDPAEPGGQP